MLKVFIIFLSIFNLYATSDINFDNLFGNSKTVLKKEQSISIEKHKLTKKELQEAKKDIEYSSFKPSIIGGVIASMGRTSEKEGSIGNHNVKYLNINVECITGLPCSEKILKIYGPHGSFESVGDSFGTIKANGYSSVKGKYHFSVIFNDSTLCRGDFYLSGTKHNFDLRLYHDCRDAGSIEY